MTYLFANAAFLAWSSAYLIVNLIYLAKLAKLHSPVSQNSYGVMVALNITKSWIFAAGLLYLWMAVNTPELKAIACCGVFGHILRNLARTEKWTLITLTDVSTVILTIVIGGTFQMLQAQSLATQILIGVTTLGLAGYYLFAQALAVSDRQALTMSRAVSRQARKMSTMGHMTAGISHDFKNMLAVIQGNIDMANHAETAEDRTKFLEEARLSIQDASGVVGQLLGHVRAEPTQENRIDLNARLQSLRPNLSRVLPSHIDLTVSPPEKEIPITVDVQTLEMSLLNLVINARDAMAETGGTVCIDVTESDLSDWPVPLPNTAASSYVRIDVTDQGPGIPPHLISSVTEPFVSTKPPESGSGLGLAMVREFISDVGGDLHLQNRSGGGLKVSLLLPTGTPEKLAA